MGITIINHPPVITIDSWYVHHSQSWVVYDILIPTLQNVSLAGFRPGIVPDLVGGDWNMTG